MKFLFALFLALIGLAHAGPAPLTWSPADHSEFVSGGGSTATRISLGGGAYQPSRSDTSQSIGVRTVTFNVTSIGSLSGVTGPGLLLGLGNGRAPINAYAGIDNNGVSLSYNGNILKNQIWTGVSLASFTTGDTIGMVADLNAHTVKFNKNGGAYSATVDITSLGADVYVMASLGNGTTAASVQITSDNWNDFPWTTLAIIASGDSMTLGGGALRPYLPRLVDLIESNRAGWAQGTRLGINGVSWQLAWSEAGYPYNLTQDITQRVVPALAPALPNWIVTLAGTNGIVLAHHTAATEYSHLTAYLSALMTATGIPASRIVVCTMLPRTGMSETTRGDYNAAIVGDAGGIGYKVARLDLDPNIGAAGQSTNTTWFIDGTHPTDAGHQVIAQIVYGVMFP